MNVAILGAGNIGGTLGQKWLHAGLEVVFGVRDTNSPKAASLREALGPTVEFHSIARAISAGEVVLFATPHAAVAGILADHKAALAEKTIIDATNNFGAPVVNNLSTILEAAPSAHAYRAFNASGWENFADPLYGGVPVDCFYCGPDLEARASIENLITLAGLRPIYVGGLETAPIVDALGSLWVTLVQQRGYGRKIALKLLER